VTWAMIFVFIGQWIDISFPPKADRRASIQRSNLPAAHTTCLWQAGLRGMKPKKNK
jgi:hypothetical protein